MQATRRGQPQIAVVEDAVVARVEHDAVTLAQQIVEHCDHPLRTQR